MTTIIFTGITGINKRHVLKRLRKEVLRQHSDSTYRALAANLDHPAATRYINQYSLEDHIDRTVGMETFLTDDDKSRQRRRWRESFLAVQEATENDNPTIALISAHLSFQRVSHIFSPLCWQFGSDDAFGLFKKLNPTCCVNLIDDIYSVQRRIKPGTKIRLREIITWRQVENFLTDLLAKELFKPSGYSEDWPYECCPVVATKHPPATLYRLLFRKDILRIYASVPISNPRREPTRDGTSRVEAFIRSLEAHFTVYNPLTIDEKPLEFLPRTGDMAKLPLDFSPGRWPPQFANMLSPESADDYPIELRTDEVVEVSQPMSEGQKSEISRHIEQRDFRLIDQSDCVAVYRMTYGGGDPSGGIYREIIYAKGRRPCFFVFDPDSGDSTSPSTLQPEPDVMFVGPDESTIPVLIEKLHAQAVKRPAGRI